MRRMSIRVKLTIGLSLILMIVTGITFFTILYASRMVLRSTIRDYLISTVEENVGKIRYTEEKTDPRINSYISYGEGFLEIDLDYMEVVNEVSTALYTSDGRLLYGENPLHQKMTGQSFKDIRTWYEKIDGIRYGFYDRKLNLDPAGEGPLWLRGVVSESGSTEQLKEIMHISLFLLPLFILLAAFLGYVISDKLLAPLLKIEKATEQISKGDDLKQRVDPGKNQDEIGRLAMTFNRMLDRLEHAFEAERRFTSDASHELRTPTAVILAETEYTLEKERSGEEYKEALETVERQAQRMKTLIEDMLDYTRMDQSEERYPMEQIELSEVVRETAAQMAVIGEKGITLTTDIAPGLRIIGNKQLMIRLTQNLISNAYRYGKENGHTKVLLKAEGDEVCLTVSDDGIGIAKEEQEKIFERFYRSDASRSVQGTGLGLSMVKRITELHHGRLELTSAPGEGSSFCIRFQNASSAL